MDECGDNSLSTGLTLSYFFRVYFTLSEPNLTLSAVANNIKWQRLENADNLAIGKLKFGASQFSKIYTF